MKVRIAFCVAALLALAGCAETTLVCSEPGYVLDDQGRCRPESEARDGGLDGGPDGGVDAGTDSGPPDAGPCGTCDSGTPYCVEVGGEFECVECVDDPNCGDEYCVDNQCVQCRDHGDCTDPAAAQCDSTGSCVPCSSPAHCPPDRAVCATVRTPSTCVQCIATAQCTPAGAQSCDLLTGTCVAVAPFTLPTCAPCTNDDQCSPVLGAVSRCIPLSFEGTFHGNFCLPEVPVGGCENHPYTVPRLNRMSVNGFGPANYCGINENLTTCEAVIALVGNVRCPGGDTDCPAGSICRDLAGGATPDRCTYRCGSPSDCLDPSTRPTQSTCGTGSMSMDGPAYCGG